jgi:hypothetical protein
MAGDGETHLFGSHGSCDCPRPALQGDVPSAQAGLQPGGRGGMDTHTATVCTDRQGCLQLCSPRLWQLGRGCSTRSLPLLGLAPVWILANSRPDRLRRLGDRERGVHRFPMQDLGHSAQGLKSAKRRSPKFCTDVVVSTKLLHSVQTRASLQIETRRSRIVMVNVSGSCTDPFTRRAKRPPAPRPRRRPATPRHKDALKRGRGQERERGSPRRRPRSGREPERRRPRT